MKPRLTSIRIWPLAGVYISLISTFAPLNNIAQETNTQVTAVIKTENDEALPYASILLVHEPTNNSYSAFSNAQGRFYIFNVRPGGPYRLIITHTAYRTLVIPDLYLGLFESHFHTTNGRSEFSHFIMTKKTDTLPEISLKAVYSKKEGTGTGKSVGEEIISIMPSINRNFQDFVRLIPEARVNGEGKMSIAGQNNKFNSIFIDGSDASDPLGIAVSGTAGGQTGTPPVSIEAIEELKVSIAPFDAQYSNFTGAGIHAITRSGSNQFKSSAWYYFRNENMAGRSPVPIQMPGSNDAPSRPRLPDLFNQTVGIWASGPVLKNKLFYFFLTEFQDEVQPQPFNFSVYRGNSSFGEINNLADTLRKKYNYDPGSFLDIENELLAKRVLVKIDWNPNSQDKLTFQFRNNYAERKSAQQQNSPDIIRFSNNQFRLLSNNLAASIEWKRYVRGHGSNRLLFTFNREITDREITGQEFPSVRIQDGSAAILFGSNASSHLNVFKASSFSLLNVYRLQKNRHVISAGVDLNLTQLKDILVLNYFGGYTFRSLDDFLNNQFATQYSRGISLVDKPVNDKTKAGAHFNVMRAGIFVNDEFRFNDFVKLTAGMRLDGQAVPLKYTRDDFFNTIARPEIEKFYSLDGAVSGRALKAHWQLSPRLGFEYRIPESKIVLRGGGGIFTGHVLNLWLSEIYFSNQYMIDMRPHTVRFSPDPYNQPDLQELGIDPDLNKGNMVLLARNFKFPAVFRSTASIQKRTPNNWQFSAELIFTKNIHEHRYVNVNLKLPELNSSDPGSRIIYSLGSQPDRIPMQAGNPYNNIFLLTNNRNQKGYSWYFSTSAMKNFEDNFYVSLSYGYGRSTALFEAAGNSNNSSQWTETETVNGRNAARRSISDFDPGHRIAAAVSKKIDYGKMSTLVTLFYNGQSGSTYSYVYSGTIVNDIGRTSDLNYDLFYIPTRAELDQMEFISGNNSAEIQRRWLNEFIKNDSYLRKRRGRFAERNGARTPFTHVVDLRLQQNLKIQIGKKKTLVSIIYDVFNFTNMLNRHWGRTYFVSHDQVRLITIAGFNGNLTPQYQYTPLTGKPWMIQSSTAPGTSARWISQLGIRITM